MIFLKNHFVSTTCQVDVISIIHEINYSIREAKIPDGLLTVIITDPGAALAILEPLAEIVEQFKSALEIFPGEGTTLSRKKEPISLAPRIKAAMLGKTVHIPLQKGKLVLGSREEVLVIDFDETAKRREFYVHIIGEVPAQPRQAPAGKPPARR